MRDQGASMAKEELPTQTISLGGIASGSATGAAILSTRIELVVQHMLAAARFARKAGEVEQAHLGEDHGEFFDEISHYATAAVLFSVASLEANINEIFIDADAHMPQDKHNLVRGIWAAYNRRPNILDKYRIMHILKTGQEPNKGARVYQKMVKVITVRNALVHFVPQWTHESEEHDKIAQQLQSENLVSPFRRTNPVFPTGYMGHALAKWAVTSSQEFMQKFSQETGLPNRFAGRQGLNPE